jgi:hypothetical protein
MSEKMKYFLIIQIFFSFLIGIKSQNDITNSPFYDTLYQAHVEALIKDYYFDNFSVSEKIIWDSLQNANKFDGNYKKILSKMLEKLDLQSYNQKDTTIRYFYIGIYQRKKRYLVKGDLSLNIIYRLTGSSRVVRDFEIIEYDNNKVKHIPILDSLDFIENRYKSKEELSEIELFTGKIDTMYFQNDNIKIIVDYHSWMTPISHNYKKEVNAFNNFFYSKVIEYEGIPTSLVEKMCSIYQFSADKEEILTAHLVESNFGTHKIKKGTLYFFSFRILFANSNPFPKSKVNYYSDGYGIYNILMFYDGKRYKLLGQNFGKEGDNVKFTDNLKQKFPDIQVLNDDSKIYKFVNGKYKLVTKSEK